MWELHDEEYASAKNLELKLLSSKKISEKYHKVLCCNRNGNSHLILRAGYWKH